MKKIATALGMILVFAIVTVGCGKTSPTGEETGAQAEIKEIIVGTGNAYEPYCYLDDTGEVTGYEYEVLKAVDELLPQYEFSYQTSDFPNVLIALDAGKVDIAAHQYERNEERETKYLFGEEAYTTYVTYIAVASDREDIRTLDDLQGKTVRTSPGSNSTYILEEYNEEHTDNPIILDFIDGITYEELVTGIVKGIWDADIRTKRDVTKFNEAYGEQEDVVKTVGEAVQSSSTYFLFNKDNQELQQAVDGAIKELRESGKLSEISVNVLGGDFTESE